MSRMSTRDIWWITYDRGGIEDDIYLSLEDAQKAVRSLCIDPFVNDIAIRELLEVDTVDLRDFLSGGQQ